MFYGLGVIFGAGTALNGGIPLTTGWLLTAYALLGLLVAANLYADGWMKQVATAAEASPPDVPTPELAAWIGSNRPRLSLAAEVVVTMAIVFVMVVKPQIVA